LEKAGAGATSAEVKGKIVEFSFWMLKEGYAQSTIERRTAVIKTLVKRGANLYDPEGMKRIIATQKTWGDGAKANAVDAYTCFLSMEGLSWKPPKYRRAQRLPFIPLESELDQLIAGCGKKVATFLQGLKETGADPGELWRVEWTDIDTEKKVVTVNHPVKGHDPRILPISNKWVSMIEKLPNESQRVFSASTLGSYSANFRRQRKRLAAKLNNPRLLKTVFTTFRHWKGTMEYHKTKDIIHVKQVLGHKSIKNTMVYINLEAALFQVQNDEFTVKVAKTLDDACSLVEAGFDYVTDMDGGKIFRKRK